MTFLASANHPLFAGVINDGTLVIGIDWGAPAGERSVEATSYIPVRGKVGHAKTMVRRNPHHEQLWGEEHAQ